MTDNDKSPKFYHFWVEDNDGKEIRWTNLTIRQAKSMFKWTEEQNNPDLKRFGWSITE